MSSILSWIIRKGRFMERGSSEEIASRSESQRGDYPTPQLVRDQIDPVRSQHDGRTYESRSDLYRSYKEGGVRIVEKGERPVEHHGVPITRDEVEQATAKVKQGYKPAPLEQADEHGEPPPLPDDDEPPQLPLDGI